MTPIRTLFLISSIDPAPPEGGKTAGGAERLTRDVCLNIDRSRIEPVLLLHYPPSGVGPELSSAGIEWHVAHRHAHNPFPFWMKLKTLIRREKIRAVVSMNQGPNFDNLAVTPFVRGTGCVISVSGVHMPERIYRTEGKISGRAHILVFPSEYSRENNAPRYAIADRRIRVIPNGCDTKRFSYAPYAQRKGNRRRLGLPEDAFILYTPSRIHRKKGQDVMAEAMTIIGEYLHQKNAVWVNTGLTQHADIFEKLSAFSSLIPGRIITLPPVSNAAEYMAAADAVAIPSRDESFSLVALEASSCGRIFVGTNCGAIPEIAANMTIAVSTLRTHIRNIYQKLDTHSRFETVSKARELNLL